MTNYEKIHNLSIEEFAKWLEGNCDSDVSPWILWFDKKYCKQCVPVVGYMVDDEDKRLTKFSYCETHNNQCRYFAGMEEAPNNKQIIQMWLEEQCND